MRGESDLARRLRGPHMIIDFERDVRFARNVGRVMHDGAEDQFVPDICESRHRRFDHDRLVDLEGRLPGAKLILTRRCDGDDAIARKAVRRFEFRMGASLRIGSKSRVPEWRGDEIFSQSIERRRAAFAVADQITLVGEVSVREILAQKRGQGEARGDAQAA